MLFLDLLLRRDFRHLALSFNKSKSETNSTISKQQCSPSEAKPLRPYTGKYLFQKEHCFRFWHIFPSYPQAFSSLWPLFRLLAPKHESTILLDLGSENCTTPKYSNTICYPNVHDLETQEKKHQLGHQLWAYGYFLSKNCVWWLRLPAGPAG